MPVAAPIKPNLNDARLGSMRRDFTFQRDAIDKEKRTVRLAFASETPVDRYFGQEILDCSAKACDLSRLNDGGAFLWMHDPQAVLGVVEAASMETDKTGRAVVRFSGSEFAQQYFQDVQDGILRKVSVGYRVQDMVLQAQSDDGDVYRVTRWQPMEISLVSIPADSSVGVGRSHEPGSDEPAQHKPISTMPTEPAAITAAPPAEIQDAINKATGAESSRVAEILAICDRFPVPAEKRNAAIKEKQTVEAFQRYVMLEVVGAKPVEVNPNIGMSNKEKKRYSLLRQLYRLSNQLPVDGIEREASEAAAKLYKRETPGTGFIIPHDMAQFMDPELNAAMNRISGTNRFQTRATGDFATIFAQGGAFVQTDVLGGSLIELLRNKTLLNTLGVVNLTGLVGNVAIPKQTGAATAYWLDETGVTTQSNQSTGQVAFTPKRLGASTPYTKQFLAQSSVDAEAFVRDDLMKILAIGKDLAGIAGTGGGQPLGIINTPNVNSETFSTTATLAKVLGFETDIMTANADIGAMNWLTNITVRNKWKQIAQLGSTFPIFLCGPDNRANGYLMNVTNQIPTASGGGFTAGNMVIFGAFNQAIMADWAGMDVVVNPYSLDRENEVRITVTILTDFGVRHAQSFAVSTDSGAQ